jgi:DnaJ-class molecular chaperone
MYCPQCNGSGEGLWDGSACSRCRGEGEVPDKAEYDDQEPDIPEVWEMIESGRLPELTKVFLRRRRG